MESIKIYQVGGSVRDELLGIKSKDIDYAVEAPSFEVMKEYLTEKGYKIFLETPEYLTIRAKFPDGHPFIKLSGGVNVVDFTLCRTESGYSDSRHPDEVKVSNLMGDLSRRDFTVNAIAKDIDGSFIDPFNGQKDLENGILKCVGNAHDRLEEDALRALRAIRFTITKGFEMDDELRSALQSKWLPPLLEKISIERVRQELYKAFAADTLRTMKILHEFSDEFRAAVFRDELWLQPTSKKSKSRFRKYVEDHYDE